MTSEHLIYGQASEAQREFLSKVLDLGLRFADGSARNRQVVRYATVDELKQLVSSPLPGKGENLDSMYDALENQVAAYSIAQGDPRYLAFPDTGNSVATLAADILAGFLNQNLIAVDRSAPIGTFIEAQVILWLRQIVGYPTYELRDLPNLTQLGGMWTSGGNLSNHVAVLGALHHRYPQVSKSGLIGLKRRPVILLAKGVEHFSFAGAAQTLGLGQDSLLWSAATDDYTTDVNSIKEILANPPDGVEPFIVISVAGNCRTTNIDNLKAIGDVCREHNVWFHVDACHGGSLLFSEKLRTQLQGVELADSISLDPHKGFFTTYASSYVLFRDPTVLRLFARYPDKASDPSCFDLGLITPFFGSRGFQSLKLWLLLKHLGVEGMARLVEGRDHTFRQMVQLLENTGLFTLISNPKFYRLAFVFCPATVRALLQELHPSEPERDALHKLISRYTAAFCEELYRQGDVVLDLFTLQDLGNQLGLGTTEKYDVMGMSVGHPYIAEEARAAIHDRIVRLGSAYERRMMVEMANGSWRNAPVFGGGCRVIDSPAAW